MAFTCFNFADDRNNTEDCCGDQNWEGHPDIRAWNAFVLVVVQDVAIGTDLKLQFAATVDVGDDAVSKGATEALNDADFAFIGIGLVLVFANLGALGLTLIFEHELSWSAGEAVVRCTLTSSAAAGTANALTIHTDLKFVLGIAVKQTQARIVLETELFRTACAEVDFVLASCALRIAWLASCGVRGLVVHRNGDVSRTLKHASGVVIAQNHAWRARQTVSLRVITSGAVRAALDTLGGFLLDFRHEAGRTTVQAFVFEEILIHAARTAGFTVVF